MPYIEHLHQVSNCGYVVSGTLTPDATGNYEYTGTHNAYPYYTREDGVYVLFRKSGLTAYVISDALDQITNCWENASVNPATGAYSAVGTATGAATTVAWIRANVYTSTYTVRESAIKLTDTSHLGLYTGECTTMETSDIIQVEDTSVSKFVGGYVYESTNMSAIKTDTAAILEDTGATLPASIATLPTDADVQAACDSAITANTDINNIDTGVNNLETACIDNATGADIAADIIALKAETAAILADTNELQVDDYPTALTAIQAVTDQFVFTGSTVNANMSEGGVGSGSSTVNYYVYTNESEQTGAISNCSVWVSTDLAGVTVIASGTTDSNGKVTFYLNPATYYFWRSKSGYSFTNPDTEIIA